MNADNFSIVAAVLHADWVVRLVMIGLAIASLWSWAIIIDKAFRFTALNREADKFEDEVASGRSLEDVAQAAAKVRATPCPACCRRRFGNGARPGASASRYADGLLIQRIDRSLDSTVAAGERAGGGGPWHAGHRPPPPRRLSGYSARSGAS